MLTYLRSSLRADRWLAVCAPCIGIAWLATCSSDDSGAGVTSGAGTMSSGSEASGSAGSNGSTVGDGAGGGAGTAGSAGGQGGAGQGGTDGVAGSGGQDGGASGKIAAGVRWVGRVDTTDPMKPRFGWGGAGFVARISGTSLSVQVNNDNAVFFQPVVDGTAGARIRAGAGMNVLQIATGLVQGTHTIELYRETEASQGVTELIGISGSTLMTPSPYPGRLIETIGDSISAGYGDLGLEIHPNNCSPAMVACHYTPDTQSEYQSYTALVARALGADFSIVANSGWGLYKDNTGAMSNVMPKVWEQTYMSGAAPPTWDFAEKADAVIINLGTNDTNGQQAGPGFKDALKTFVGTIRSKYPNAWIFPVTGPMLSGAATAEIKGYMQAAITELGDAKMFYVDLGAQNCAATGCDYHPNVTEHQRLAGILTPVLKQKLGW